MTNPAPLAELMSRTVPSLGSRLVGDGVAFLVWAPNALSSVDVVLEAGGRHPLERGEDGYWSGTIPGIGAGTRYRYSLDGGQAFPDPCSRFQPEGVHGPSEVVNPDVYGWTDGDWRGVSAADLVIYELHVGAMTPEGTFAALRDQLPALRDLGVTAIEIMPVAEAPGRWNWGYDGVDLWAPSHNYGTPDDLRDLVDSAHTLGLGVVLDVVYNHFGPDGNYLGVYSSDYLTDRHETPWGGAVNVDGQNNRPVRDFVIGNALHWVREYHIDGLRLDATHAIVDESRVHILTELGGVVRADAAPREVVLIAEDDRNDVSLITSPLEGGIGMNAIWADDFHHEMHVFLTGQRDGYYRYFDGTPASIAAVIHDGLTWQGQARPDGEKRGTVVTNQPGSAFVFCLQNHDQVGNRAVGDRITETLDPATWHVASAVLLLAPETPMLFMGQEFRASTPFQYFTDHQGELGRLVTEGRRREFEAFSSFAETDGADVPDPQDESTFLRSKLDLGERETHADTLALYRDLLELIRTDPVLSVRDRAGSVTAARGDMVMIYRRVDDGHRLLFANFGDGVRFPLRQFAAGIPDAPKRAHVLFDSGAAQYGGDRTAVFAEGGASVPGRTAVLLGW